MQGLILVFHILSLGVFWKPDYLYLLNHVKDAGDLEYYFKTSYTYTPDVSISENWQSPAYACKTWQFDCEEAAVIVKEVLENAGYICNLYIVYNKDEELNIINAHAICTYKKGNDIGLFSNGVRYSGMSHMDFMKVHDYICWEIISDWREYEQS